VVLLASALKLLGVGNIAMLWIVAAAVLAAAAGWSAVRTRARAFD
jgi:hypothetical protein